MGFTFLGGFASLVVEAAVAEVGLRSGRGRSVAERARAPLNAGALLVNGPVDGLEVVVIVVAVENHGSKVDVPIHPDLTEKSFEIILVKFEESTVHQFDKKISVFG